MQKTIIGLLALLMTTPVWAQSIPVSKIYIATGKAGQVVIVNGDTQSVMKSIDLGQTMNGEKSSYTAHNVQVAPDGRTVWVTANAWAHKEGEASHSKDTEAAHDMEGSHDIMPAVSEHADMPKSSPNDEVIVIDSKTDTIIKRIALPPKSHLAHVVITPDSRFAYVTAQETGIIYKIDTGTYGIEKIDLPEMSGPHGFRIDPAGEKAYVALMSGKGLGILDIATDAFTIVPLDGAAVQTAILPNGKWVFISLYDTKKIALYNVANAKVSYVSLPKTSQGPVQLYPAMDGSALYIADQGYYFGRPTSTRIYKFDFIARKIKTIPGGQAPHGITVSKDGRWAYVTNLLGRDISIIDTKTNRETRRIEVGEEPNGVSEWTRE